MSIAQKFWHTLDRVVHMVCKKDDNTSVVRLKGVLDHLPEGGNFWIFHVCTQQPILQLGKRYLSFQSPAEIFVSTLSESKLAWKHSDALIALFDKFLFRSSISDTSLSKLVVKLLSLMFSSLEAIDRLLSCSTITIGLIRKLLIHVVRNAFFVRFRFRCPKHLHRILDLSLLSHLFHNNRC